MDVNRKCSSCGEPISDDSAADECAKCLRTSSSEGNPDGKELSLPTPAEPAVPSVASKEPGPNQGSTITSSTALTEGPDKRIARYKLLRQIGEGGCGVVFLAEQEVPVRRRVALKVIKPGMDT